MIGRLKGILLEKKAPHLLIDVNGVGYEVDAPMTTIFSLPEVGEEVTLHIHMVVREDAQLLYGFSQEQDRRLFRTLIKVNGVGPKLAITILSGMDSYSFAQTVAEHNVQALVKLPGVGKKTAERLLVEMQDRIKDWEMPPLPAANTGSASTATTPMASPQDSVHDAETALIALGYKPQEASRAVAAVREEGLSSEELIKRALKNMVKG